MKIQLFNLRSPVILACLLCPLLQADEKNSITRSSTTSGSTGDQSAITKKSVTVTSDGRNTVRRIVTVRNGVETIVTETIDEDGKVTTNRNEPLTQTPDPNRPWLGLRVQTVSNVLRSQLDLANDEGLVVDVVAPNGPASKAGITAGDLLLRLSDQPVASPGILLSTTLKHKIGDIVPATIMRKGKRSNLKITLGKQFKAPKKPPEEIAGGFLKRDEGSIELSVKNNDDGNPLDAILSDPNVPKQFKENVRKMQEKLRNFEKRHGIK